MRTRILTLVLLLTPVLALADVVPQESAKSAAARFLGQKNPSSKADLQRVFEAPRLTKTVSTAPAYYLFNNAGGGYVIAAGDDSVPAVLAYSVSGTLDDATMPDNLRAWLDMWTEIVEKNRASGAAPYPETPATKAGSGKVLETARWGQRSPFYDHTVTIDGTHALTGCNATATAILMRYHQWPQKGSGTLPSYKDKNGNEIGAVTLGHTYDWSNMPLAYTGTETSEQKEAVAVLMRDVGVMIQSSYSTNNPSAYKNVIPGALVKYMDYDASIYMDRKRNYPETGAWTRRLIEEIDAGSPVIYAGYYPDNSGGHTFIVDGYDEQGYMHINWGWNGTDNDYFLVPEFQEYTFDHTAIFSAKKNSGGTVTERIEIYDYGIRMTDDTADIKKGEAFKVDFKVLNASNTDITASLAVGKFDRDDKLQEVVSQQYDFLGWKFNYYYELSGCTCTITTDIHAGDYLAVVWKSVQSPQWTQVIRNYENSWTVSRLMLGDSVLLDENVELRYIVSTGILIADFDCDCTRELRTASGTVVTTGVTDDGEQFAIDTKQLTAGTYILHMTRGEQVKDIRLKLGLKK